MTNRIYSTVLIATSITLMLICDFYVVILLNCRIMWIFYSLQALWQLLWVNPTAPTNPLKSFTNTVSNKKHPLEFIQHRVSIVASELLSQVGTSFRC